MDQIDSSNEIFVAVLGIAQDGGFPQCGCHQECCAEAQQDSSRIRDVACLAIVEAGNKRRWMIDCTPDFPRQLHRLDSLAVRESGPSLDGLLLTHAHMGHYAGLVHLGTEAMNTDRLPVFVMPRMAEFLRSHAPWRQLVERQNIELHDLADGHSQTLGEQIRVKPLLVPHRAEYTETVAYRIEGSRGSVLYLPDVDGWNFDSPTIEEMIEGVDVAYLDGTFFSGEELPGRDMSVIAHPTICQSMQRFASLPEPQRTKIHFLHLNHTNPALNPHSQASRQIAEAGFCVAEQGEWVKI